MQCISIAIQWKYKLKKYIRKSGKLKIKSNFISILMGNYPYVMCMDITYNCILWTKKTKMWLRDGEVFNIFDG